MCCHSLYIQILPLSLILLDLLIGHFYEIELVEETLLHAFVELFVVLQFADYLLTFTQLLHNLLLLFEDLQAHLINYLISLQEIQFHDPERIVAGQDVIEERDEP